jgi:RsiW-degrading membrane proteinase PrsW (M82 family)
VTYPAATDPAPRLDGRHNERHPAWVAAFILGGVVVAAQATRLRGAGTITVAALLALIPFVGILLFSALLQHHEKRPRTSTRWSLLWGGLVATGASSYANSFLFSRPDWTAVVLVAPVVEETAKIAGLLFLLRWGRIRNPLDGLVYAVLIGGSFSLVENVFYFHNAVGAELSGNDGVLRDVFLVRGLAASLAHPLFLAIAGIAAGLHHGRTGRRTALVAGGWFAGIAVHGLWNHLALAGMLERASWRIAPVFATFATGAILLAAHEGRTDRTSTNEARPTGTSEEHWSSALPWYAPSSSLTNRSDAAPSETPTTSDPAAGNQRQREQP